MIRRIRLWRLELKVIRLEKENDVKPSPRFPNELLENYLYRRLHRLQNINSSIMTDLQDTLRDLTTE